MMSKITFFGLAFFIPISVCARVLGVDDFDERSFKNQLGGLIQSDTAKPGTCSLDFSKKGCAQVQGSALKIHYDISSPGSRTFFWFKSGSSQGEDLTPYDFLFFWLKSPRVLKGPSSTLILEIHTDQNHDGVFEWQKDKSFSCKLPLDQAFRRRGAWQAYKIPLKNFSHEKVFQNVLEIVFVLDHSLLSPRIGTIALDDLYFATHPPGHILKQKRYFLKMRGRKIRNGTTFKTGDTIEIEATANPELTRHLQISFDEGRHWLDAAKQAADTSKIQWKSFFLKPLPTFSIRVIHSTSDGRFLNPSRSYYVCQYKPFPNQKFLEILRQKACQYFIDHQSLQTGLFRDTSWDGNASIAVTGMGLAALCIASERGYLPREEVQKRVLGTVNK